jgi:quercetin dioxygenase-like cupin family protein
MSVFHKLEEIPVHKFPVGDLRVIAGKQAMVFWAKIPAGGHTDAHQHPNEQITWVVSGRVDYKLETGEEKSCGPGTVLVIPGGIVHESWYREDCEIVEFFSPPRLDLFPAAASNPYGVQ